MNRRSFFKMITGVCAGVYAACQPSKAKSDIAPELDPFPYGGVVKRSEDLYSKRIKQYTDGVKTLCKQKTSRLRSEDECTGHSHI